MKCLCCYKDNLKEDDCLTCHNAILVNKNIKMIKQLYTEFIKNQKDVSLEFVDLINKDFWNLV